MPQYLLSVCHDESYEDIDLNDPEVRAQMARTGALNDELEREGVLVFVAGLHDASTATVVRTDGAQVSMTDGPYAETKEQMGGFWIIEAPDFDAALEVAARASASCERPVEVRATHGD
jgi:hypothetical protein